MGKFYQYDTRGASASDQIMTLERLLEEANSRIEELEWENKGIEEWRGLALDFMEAARIQRERAERAEAERDELREARYYASTDKYGPDESLLRRIDAELREGK
jgi:hypothetical protein